MNSWATNLNKKIENPPKLKTRNAFCMWSDLLGFGNLYSDNYWKLNGSQRREVYNRLVNAHSAVLKYSQPTERNLILNDGIAKVYMTDDSIWGKREISNISLYIRFCIELHLTINRIERENGYLGCRSVLAFGECIEYLAEEIKFDDFVFHVWQELDNELRLLIPYDKDNLNEVVIGFSFDKNVISPDVRRYSTTVYKLLKLFPYDEKVDEFYFDLIE